MFNFFLFYCRCFVTPIVQHGISCFVSRLFHVENLRYVSLTFSPRAKILAKRYTRLFRLFAREINTPCTVIDPVYLRSLVSVLAVLFRKKIKYRKIKYLRVPKLVKVWINENALIQINTFASKCAHQPHTKIH